MPMNMPPLVINSPFKSSEVVQSPSWAPQGLGLHNNIPTELLNSIKQITDFTVREEEQEQDDIFIIMSTWR